MADDNVVELRPKRSERNLSFQGSTGELLSFDLAEGKLRARRELTAKIKDIEELVGVAYAMGQNVFDYLEEIGQFTSEPETDEEEATFTDYSILQRLVTKLIMGCMLHQRMMQDESIDGGVAPAFFNAMAQLWLTGFEDRDTELLVHGDTDEEEPKPECSPQSGEKQGTEVEKGS